MYQQVLFLLMLLPGLAGAQSVLTLEEAMNWALADHPVAKMADAVEQQGAAALLRSKGAFDPKIAANYDRKEFKGDTYFNYGTAGVEWQSPYAFKVAAGYDWAQGEYLSDDLFLSSGSQAYLAIKLPLLQGLITDAARIGRKRGDVAVDQQQAIAEIIRNELRFDVAHRYAEWLFAERTLRINEETEVLIDTYLRDTRTLFEQGDKPAVDTLEAFIYLGTQRLATQQARVDAQVAKLAFSEMYWPLEEEDQPFALEEGLLNLPIIPDWEIAQPELRDLQLLVTDYQLEQQLKQEKLKPILDANYYLLGDGLNIPIEGSGNFLTRGYKVGVTASYPIFNRKARGDVEIGRLKIVEAESKLADKRQSLQQKAAAYRNALLAYQGQLSEGTRLAEQNQQLLEAERELFRLGESTQFLLNTRQQNLQKAMLVAEKIRFSRNKAALTWRYLTAVWR